MPALLLICFATAIGWAFEPLQPTVAGAAGGADGELGELCVWLAACPDPVRRNPGQLLRRQAVAGDRLLRQAPGDDRERLQQELNSASRALESARAWEPRGGIAALLERGSRLLQDSALSPRTAQRFLDTLESSLDLEAALARPATPFHDFLFGVGVMARSRYAMAERGETDLHPLLEGWAPPDGEPMSGREAYDRVMDRARNAPLASLVLTRGGEDLSFAFIRSLMKQAGSRTRVLAQERVQQRSALDSPVMDRYLHEPIRLRMDLPPRERRGEAELWCYCKEFRVAHRFDVTVNGLLRVPFRIHPRLHAGARGGFWLAFSFPGGVVGAAPEAGIDAVLHLLPGEELRQENFPLRPASISRPALLLRLK